MLAEQRFKSTGDILEGECTVRRRKETKRFYKAAAREEVTYGLSSGDDNEEELENRRKPLLSDEIIHFYDVSDGLRGSSLSSSNNKWFKEKGKQNTTSNPWQVAAKRDLLSSSCGVYGEFEQSVSKETQEELYNDRDAKNPVILDSECPLREQQQPVTFVLSSGRQHYKGFDGIHKWQRANGARRRKVAAAHRLRLALSSPILTSKSAPLAEPLEQLTCLNGPKDRASQLKQHQQSNEQPEYNNTTPPSGQLDSLSRVKTDAPLESATRGNLESEACEAAASSMTLKATSAASNEQRIYYFVDVAHLHSSADPDEPAAAAAAALKPVQCELTLEESSCCYSGEGSNNNKSIASDKTQDARNDNSIDFFLNSYAHQPATLVAAAVAAATGKAQSEGGGQSKQQQVTPASLGTAAQIVVTAATTAVATTTTTNSNNNLTSCASGCSTILSVSDLHKQQQQQRKHFHYAPTQQVSHDNHDRELKLHLLSVENNNNNNNIRNKSCSRTSHFTSQGDGQGTSEGIQPNLSSKTNTLVGRLMGSYCNSWRQALHPTHSGSYKVAAQQQQAPTISGFCPASERPEIPAANAEQQQARNVISNGSRRTISTRLPRPIRSPISLQRQTNARLYKHRLKIQQQRQEQLTHLAIRERQQLHQLNSSQQIRTQLSTCSPGGDQAMPASRWQIAIPSNQTLYIITDGPTPPPPPPPPQQQQQQQQQQHPIDNKFNTNGTDQRDQREPSNQVKSAANNKCVREPHQQSTSRTLKFTNLNVQNQRPFYQQHQVILSTNSQPATRAIEICDNQLACTSRQDQQSNHLPVDSNLSCQLISNRTTNQQQFLFPGTKALYKSINMIHNATSSGSGASLIHHQQQPNSSGRKTTTRYENRNSEQADDTQTISSNGSTLSLNRPFCKICHVSSMKNGDKLISPCKCSGTMQYIHCGCLLKWLEISNRTNEKPMSCELCAHEYSWHKKFNYKHIKWPRCSTKDIILHIIFVIAMGIMIFSAVAPIVQKRVVDTTKEPTSYGLASSTSSPASDDIQSRPLQNPQIYHATFSGRSNHLTTTGQLAHEEKFMLICAASFFMSFFLSIYVQTKARDTLYGLVGKFLNLNQTYYITEYDHGHNHINNTTNTKQQQQQTDHHPRAYRKSGPDEATNR